MKATAQRFVMVFAIFAGVLAHAHEVRPAYLEITEHKDGPVTVRWRQPIMGEAVQKLMTGESQDLHATLIAVQKADLSFQMMMQVRNKIIQAYQEIMRTQV